VEAKKTLNNDLANIEQLAREQVFGPAEAAAQKKAAQARFDVAKEAFDLENNARSNGASASAGGVTTTRDLPPMEEGNEDSDEEEADAALDRLAGGTPTASKKKKRFFMCMPIPAL